MEEIKGVMNELEGLSQDAILHKVDNPPDVVKRIIRELKKEKGLTYARAYGVLYYACLYLKVESQFVTRISRTEDEWDHPQKEG